MAFVAFNAEQEKAKKQAEDLAKNVDETNKAFQKQEDLIGKVNQKLGQYVSQINSASNNLAVLTGAISDYELAQDQATFKAEEFRQKSKQANVEALNNAKLLNQQIQQTIIKLDNQ